MSTMLLLTSQTDKTLSASLHKNIKWYTLCLICNNEDWFKQLKSHILKWHKSKTVYKMEFLSSWQCVFEKNNWSSGGSSVVNNGKCDNDNRRQQYETEIALAQCGKRCVRAHPAASPRGFGGCSKGSREKTTRRWFDAHVQRRGDWTPVKVCYKAVNKINPPHLRTPQYKDT